MLEKAKRNAELSDAFEFQAEDSQAGNERKKSAATPGGNRGREPNFFEARSFVQYMSQHHSLSEVHLLTVNLTVTTPERKRSTADDHHDDEDERNDDSAKVILRTVQVQAGVVAAEPRAAASVLKQKVPAEPARHLKADAQGQLQVAPQPMDYRQEHAPGLNDPEVVTILKQHTVLLTTIIERTIAVEGEYCNKISVQCFED